MYTPEAFLQVHNNAATISFAPHRVSDLCRAWLVQIDPEQLNTNAGVLQISNASSMSEVDPVVDPSLIRPAERRTGIHGWHQDTHSYAFAPKYHDNEKGSIQVTPNSADHRSGRFHMSRTSRVWSETDLARSPTSLQTLQIINNQDRGLTRISGRKEAIRPISPQQAQHHIRRQRGRAPMPRNLRCHPDQASSWMDTDGSMSCYAATPIPRCQSEQVQSCHPVMLSGHAFRTNLQNTDSSDSINPSLKKTFTTSPQGLSRKCHPLGQSVSSGIAMRLFDSQSLIHRKEQNEIGDNSKSKGSFEGSNCCCIRIQGDPARNTRMSSFMEEQPPSHPWIEPQLQGRWNPAQRPSTSKNLQAAVTSLTSIQGPLEGNFSESESQSLLSESLNKFMEDNLPPDVADRFRTSPLVSQNLLLDRPLPSLRGGCGCFDDDSSDSDVEQLHEPDAEHARDSESEHSRHNDSEQLQNNSSKSTRNLSTRREQKAFNKGYAKADKIGMEEFQKQAFRNPVGSKSPGTPRPSSGDLSRQSSDPTWPATHAIDSYRAKSPKGKERQNPGSSCSQTRAFFSYRIRSSSLPERGRFGSRRTGAPFDHTSLEILQGLERYGIVQVTSNVRVATSETYMYSPWHLERELEKIQMERLVGGFSMETVMAFDPTLHIQGPTTPVLSTPGPSRPGPSRLVPSESVRSRPIQFALIPSAPVFSAPILSQFSQSSTTSSEDIQPDTLPSRVNLLDTPSRREGLLDRIKALWYRSGDDEIEI